MKVRFKIPVIVEIDVEKYSDVYAITMAEAEGELPDYLQERVQDVVTASATMADLPTWWLSTKTVSPEAL